MTIFLLTDSPQKLKSGKINDTLKNLFDVRPSYPQLQGISFFVKKTTFLQQVTGRNIQNLILKRMLGHFLKIPLLKKILVFQD